MRQAAASNTEFQPTKNSVRNKQQLCHICHSLKWFCSESSYRLNKYYSIW